MTKPFKPLLGEKAPLNEVVWPKRMSPKLDGIRLLVREGHALTKSLKPIPQGMVRDLLSNPLLEGLDSEIIVGSPVAPDCYNVTQSYVMAKKPKPPQEFRLYVFDDFTHPLDPFEARLARALERASSLADRFPLVGVHHSLVHSVAEAEDMYSSYLDLGYEGAMLRCPKGHYKFGRSTVPEGILLKHKPMVTFEAEITGYYESETNTNEATKDELGHTKRSSAKAGKVAAGTLGGVYAKRLSDGVDFRCGIFKGLKADDLLALWNVRETLPGRKFKCESFAIGEKDRPRHPRWIGWWTEDDASLA